MIQTLLFFNILQSAPLQQGVLRITRVGGLRVPPSEELEGLDTLFGNHWGGSKKSRSGVVAPDGVITIVCTDVQGSTQLWGADPHAMSASTALHDHIMRAELARSGGYEITTEGDAFLIAFNSPVDAVMYCNRVQTSLLLAEWPESLLDLADARDVYEDDPEDELDDLQDVMTGGMDSSHGLPPQRTHTRQLFPHPSFTGRDRGRRVFSGLRVRMGIDVGHCTRSLHTTTRTFRYKGTPLACAKALVGALPTGGVVAITHRVQAELAGQMSLLQGTSLCHLGVHVLDEKTRSRCSIFAVVPSELEIRMLRLPALRSKIEISPGFLSAPGLTPGVTATEGVPGTPSWQQRDCVSLEHKSKRKTLAMHCHDNPNARPVIVAFASLVLVEEMAVTAPNGLLSAASATGAPGSARMSDIIRNYTHGEAGGGGGGGADTPTREGEAADGSMEGSVRRGVAHLNQMLGESFAATPRRQSRQSCPTMGSPEDSPAHPLHGNGDDDAKTLRSTCRGDDSAAASPGRYDQEPVSNPQRPSESNLKRTASEKDIDFSGRSSPVGGTSTLTVRTSRASAGTTKSAAPAAGRASSGGPAPAVSRAPRDSVGGPPAKPAVKYLAPVSEAALERLRWGGAA